MSELNYVYNLSQLFSKVVLENQNLCAIKDVDGIEYSYDFLNKTSNQIADFLLNLDVKQNDVVAIFNNKTILSYSIMIACLKTGITYTNLDPNSPEERLIKIIASCKPKLFFSFSDELDDVLEGIGYNKNYLLNYNTIEFKDKIASYPNENRCEIGHSTGNVPAYIMFTSGSTGFPKGVTISHSNILNFINWAKQTYGIKSNDVFTNLNPMHFDNSVFDFYAALFTGARLLPITESLTINPRKLLNVLNELKPTIWFSVPSMLVYMLNMRALKKEDLPSLRVVTFGGEGFPKNKLRELWNKWGGRVRFVNVYGPTECTCICSSYEVKEEDMLNDELLPIGPIAPNFSAFILDENHNLVKDGEIGELCIGGPNVGIGYYNSLDKTKEVFIDNPLIASHSEKIYKSGDLVCYDNEINSYLFKGRKDNQIKRMGYRIELEEIENALNTIDFIQEAAVIYVNNENYQSKIIACLKSNVLDENKINSEISKYLPRYMMPDKIDFFNSLPKNQNGKIDRLSLKTNYNS